MIPNIIRDYLSPHKNILLNIFKEKNFTDYKNTFRLHKIKIGPFTQKTRLNILVEDFKQKIKFDSRNELDNINYKYYTKEQIINRKRSYFTIVEFISEFNFDSDINIKIESKQYHFNLWLNLFYISLERYFLCLNELFEQSFLKKSLKENSQTIKEKNYSNNTKNTYIYTNEIIEMHQT